MALVGAVSLTNKEGVFLGSVSVDNIDLGANQVAYSSDGTAINGTNNFTFDGTSKLHLGEALGFSNTYETNIEAVTNANQSTQNFILQNKSSGAVASTNLYVTNDATVSQDSNYSVIGMNGSQYAGANYVTEKKSGLYIANTNSDLAMSVNAIGSGSGIHLSGDGGVEAISINEHNAISLGTTYDGTTDTYTYNCGNSGQVLTSAGALSKPTWTTPSAGISIANQANTRVPFETAVSNSLDSSANLTFNSGTNTLAVPNLTVTNINGSAPATSNVSVTSQAVNRLITATSTTDTLHANQDAVWDGTQLSLFNTSKVNIGRGNSASSAVSNTAVGAGALPSITTGTGNTVIGNNNEAISTQQNNTVIGSGNGANMTSGGTHLGNTIVGQGNNIATTGTQNSIIMGQGSKTGSTSVAIGNDILNNTGMNSVYIGHQAGRSATSTTNVVIGSTSATSMTTGSGNVIIGYFTEFTTNPTQSVVIGNNASAKGGLGSIAIGYASAGNGKIGANSSLALGYNTQTGSFDNCACIGQNMPSTTVGAINEMVIGNASNYVRFQQPIVNPSDARDKVDIKDAELGLDFLEKLKPRMWRSNLRTLYNEVVTDENGNVEWKQTPNDGSKAGKRFHYGIVAQELKQVIDEMGIDFVALKDTSVTGGGTGDFQIAYGEFFGVFIKAFQELSTKNKDLEARIKALESR